MATLRFRDFVRFIFALLVVTFADIILFVVLGLPRDTDAELMMFAAAFTLLCAIREGQGGPA